jgi:hypothetical protein
VFLVTAFHTACFPSRKKARYRIVSRKGMHSQKSSSVTKGQSSWRHVDNFPVLPAAIVNQNLCVRKIVTNEQGYFVYITRWRPYHCNWARWQLASMHNVCNEFLVRFLAVTG